MGGEGGVIATVSVHGSYLTMLLGDGDIGLVSRLLAPREHGLPPVSLLISNEE